MDFMLRPWQLYLVILAGWVNRQQQEVIEYLHAENQVLREKLGKKRIVLSDDQRRRLAVKGKILGRKMLKEVGTLITPDTILCWHRTLVAQKWDYRERRKVKASDQRISRAMVTSIDHPFDLVLQTIEWGFVEPNPSDSLQENGLGTETKEN